MSEANLGPLIDEIRHLRETVADLTAKLEAKRSHKTFCTKCGKQYNHRFERISCPHLPVVHKRKYKLKPEEVDAIIKKAEAYSVRDYLIFRLLGLKGFRVGTIVGSDPRVRDRITHKWVPAEPKCKGLMIEDLRDNGIWVHAKGVSAGRSVEKFYDLPEDLLFYLRDFVGNRKAGKIFELSIGRVEQLTKQYAREIDVKDWMLVKPHSFRHFVTTRILTKLKDPFLARDYMGHKNITTTNTYADEKEPEETAQATKMISDLLEKSSV